MIATVPLALLALLLLFFDELAHRHAA